MTGRQLVDSLLSLGEENLGREVIMFDGPSYFTPYKVEVAGEELKRFKGKIIID